MMSTKQIKRKYLALVEGKIDKKQYELGLEKAEEVIKNNGEVKYQQDLHNSNKR